MMQKSFLKKPRSESQLETIADQLVEEAQKADEYSQAEIDTIKRMAQSASMLSLGHYAEMVKDEDNTSQAIVNKLYPNANHRLKYGIVKVLDSLVSKKKERVS